MARSAALNRRQLNAIGSRIRAEGDTLIAISHVVLARLCITAEVPFGFGRRMLEIPHEPIKRDVDAAALNALLLIAEAKLPPEPSPPMTHPFRPARRTPWICRDCGYGPGEPLKHPQAVA